jgi:DNA-directed RNA polymerase specialized sigma24 family protein
MGEGGTRGQGQGQDATRRRWPVSEAAEVLGITVDALRSRIKRGAIDHVREGGRVYVLLDPGQGTASQGQGDTSQGQDTGQDYRDALIDTLREQLVEERNANRENRRLLAAALERIPAIEAPETRDAPENTTEPRPATEAPASDTEQPRASGWRRFFGLG